MGVAPQEIQVLTPQRRGEAGAEEADGPGRLRFFPEVRKGDFNGLGGAHERQRRGPALQRLNL